MTKLNFEASMNRLEEIVSSLQDNEVGLENSLKLFEEGLSLIKTLDRDLKKYEDKVSKLINDKELEHE
ncbi:MAG: exodeoxyribonuclease VII small subunit [Erysipelotrichaceae bacterium]|nr:exodeoxyribonuclease VII small subunit [Erysipelotrichaceae bacterium]MDO5085701.1 exodeoxyribonuclease VII small subunit [Erysipelotrichaceae bacterium]